jgi:hypothetical protein
MNREQLQSALRSIKAHELSRYLNRLNLSIDFGGSRKGDMLEDLADNIQSQSYMHRRIVERHQSVEQWIKYVIESVTADRARVDGQKKAKQDRDLNRQSERERMMSIAQQRNRRTESV